VRVIAPPLVAIGISILMWFLLGAYSITFAISLLFFYLMAGVAVPIISYLYSTNIGGKIISKRAELNNLILDQIQGLSELLIFGQEEVYRQKIARVNEELENLNQKMARISAMHESLIGLFMNGAVAVMLVIAIPMVSGGLLDGVYLAVISLGIMASFEALLPLPEALQFLEKNSRAAQRLFDLIDAEPQVKDHPDVRTEFKAGSIRLKNMDFQYQPDLPLVLENINMEFPSASKTAIVGPSGAGKSSLINILLRFWEYQRGSLEIDGIDIKNIAQDDLRRQIALVSQNTYLFNQSIHSNLSIAAENAQTKQLDAALDQVQLQDYLAGLADGYKTVVGDQGQKMSGGQRQRLAIARAIVKNAPILLLDEATSNLDAITEQNVLRTILDASADKTVIHITHRLTGLDKFDNIYVLDNGKVVQEGSYRELINRDGLFKKMWRLQRQQDVFKE